MKFFLRVLATLTLAAGAGSPALAYTAGPEEVTNTCVVPQRVVFQTTYTWPAYTLKRYVQLPNQALEEAVGYPTGKIFTKNLNAAPTHAQNNCPGQGNTQWASFKIKGTNYFSNFTIPHHLALMMRTTIQDGMYNGIGLAMAPFGWSGRPPGIWGERFRFNAGYENQQEATPPFQPHVPMQDGVEYLVEILAAPDVISYKVTSYNPATGAVVYQDQSTMHPTGNWRQYRPSPEHGGASGYATGRGFAFVVLCAGTEQQHCENTTSQHWSVDIYDIQMGFAP